MSTRKRLTYLRIILEPRLQRITVTLDDDLMEELGMVIKAKAYQIAGSIPYPSRAGIKARRWKRAQLRSLGWRAVMKHAIPA